MSEPSSVRELLRPLVPLYRLAVAAREISLRAGLEGMRRLPSKVVSIGNLSTGGSGKTPLAIALARALIVRGLDVDVLSRGYGRTGSSPARVRREGTAAEFGDEALMIAREAEVPVFVGASRFDAGMLAESEGGPSRDKLRVHLLDDGFQHRLLHRDVDIVLLDRRDWRDRLLPAGNLREPIRAIRRATILAVPDGDPELERELLRWGWTGELWRIRRRMDVPANGGPVAAFCGIARPRQFFAGLEAAGLGLADRTAFPDHHRYTARDLAAIESRALAAGATALVTTRKDLARLGPRAYRLPLKTAGLSIEIDRAEEALRQLLFALNAPASRHPM